MPVEQARIIRWEEPPTPKGNVKPGSRQGSRYDRVAVDLIANPGRSALLRVDYSRTGIDNLAQKIRRGRISCFEPPGDFDACVRVVDGGYGLYARYLGDGADA